MAKSLFSLASYIRSEGISRPHRSAHRASTLLCPANLTNKLVDWREAPQLFPFVPNNLSEKTNKVRPIRNLIKQLDTPAPLHRLTSETHLHTCTSRPIPKRTALHTCTSQSISKRNPLAHLHLPSDSQENGITHLNPTIDSQANDFLPCPPVYRLLFLRRWKLINNIHSQYWIN